MRSVKVLLLLISVLPLTNALAHEIRPALLEISERDAGWFDVTWKVPVRGGKALDITPLLPQSLSPLGPPAEQTIPGALVKRFTYQGNGEALTGERIVIDGLSALQTDVLLNIRLQDGVTHSAVLRPGSPEFTIPAQASKREVAVSYWRMGVIHILEGIDHLLFVFALMLIITSTWPLFKAITAFTVAHSITLALATLGVIYVPSAPTEAIIALSIVFLAAEIMRQHKHRNTSSLTARAPWLIAFVFGLIHGLGFAGALAEIGIPQHEVPLALLTFNLGVESGQILFIGVVLSLFWILRHLHFAIPIPIPKGAWRLAPYSIGALAAYWTIDRVMSFVPLAA